MFAVMIIIMGRWGLFYSTLRKQGPQALGLQDATVLWGKWNLGDIKRGHFEIWKKSASLWDSNCHSILCTHFHSKCFSYFV